MVYEECDFIHNICFSFIFFLLYNQKLSKNNKKTINNLILKLILFKKIIKITIK